jgi:hypothetical protein
MEMKDSQISLMDGLKEIKKNISTKIGLINHAYEHYKLELEGLKKSRNYEAHKGAIHPQEQIDQLSL